VNPSKIKGTAAESAVVSYLQEKGWKGAERRALQGVLDRGDISGVEGVCLEVKNQKAQDLSGWVAELTTEIINAKAETGAVIHKKKGKTNVGDWYATMPVSIYVALLKKAGY
jgi:hypothetical protein